MKRFIPLFLIAALTAISAHATTAPWQPHEANLQRLDQTLDGISTTELGILDGLTSTTAELNILDGVTATATDLNLVDQTNNATNVGAVGAAPASGTNSVVITRQGDHFNLTFTLTAAQIPVTDGAGSGSYGTYKLFDFVESGMVIEGCRSDFTAFAEGAALTGGAGDAVFEIGVGSTAISAAADGALAAAEDNICGDVNVTLSGGTGTGTLVNVAGVALNGTATAIDLNLNWSGTAATIDANSTIDVTGTLTIVGHMLGDD